MGCASSSAPQAGVSSKHADQNLNGVSSADDLTATKQPEAGLNAAQAPGSSTGKGHATMAGKFTSVLSENTMKLTSLDNVPRGKDTGR